MLDIIKDENGYTSRDIDTYNIQVIKILLNIKDHERKYRS